jgi:hypothetical protein
MGCAGRAINEASPVTLRFISYLAPSLPGRFEDLAGVGLAPADERDYLGAG